MIFGHQRFFSFFVLGIFLTLLSGEVYANSSDKPKKALTVSLLIVEKISGGETSKGKIRLPRTTENSKEEFVFKLRTDNSALIKFEPEEVKLGVGQEIVEFVFRTAPTPIKTSAAVKVLPMGAAGLSEVESRIEIVPALFKSVTGQTSMVGTHGAKVQIFVELKAPAPTGGIELYLSPVFVAGLSENLTFAISNPHIPAGIQRTSFFIGYDEILSAGTPVSTFNPSLKFNTEFNNQPRTVEFIIAIEPQTNSGSKTSLQWQPVAGLAVKTKIDVNPLRVASLSVPSSSMTGGSEALANFTLNFAPGNQEKILLQPGQTANAKIWAKPLGSSCQAAESDFTLEIPLTPGVTNYSFKVCTAPVSTTASQNIRIYFRGGDIQTVVTVQP